MNQVSFALQNIKIRLWQAVKFSKGYWNFIIRSPRQVVFTMKRKNSLFFSSKDGIESALKYHTLIQTCKNVGLNVREYFTYVFRKLIEGEKDYEMLLPSAVAR